MSEEAPIQPESQEVPPTAPVWDPFNERFRGSVTADDLQAQGFGRTEKKRFETIFRGVYDLIKAHPELYSTPEQTVPEIAASLIVTAAGLSAMTIGNSQIKNFVEEYPELTDASIEKLMKPVYERIDRLYHNAPMEIGVALTKSISEVFNSDPGKTIVSLADDLLTATKSNDTKRMDDLGDALAKLMKSGPSEGSKESTKPSEAKVSDAIEKAKAAFKKHKGIL